MIKCKKIISIAMLVVMMTTVFSIDVFAGSTSSITKDYDVKTTKTENEDKNKNTKETKTEEIDKTKEKTEFTNPYDNAGKVADAINTGANAFNTAVGAVKTLNDAGCFDCCKQSSYPDGSAYYEFNKKTGELTLLKTYPGIGTIAANTKSAVVRKAKIDE